MTAKINLLPDVRRAKLQDKQRRHMAITLTISTVVLAAGVLATGFIIIQGQNLRTYQLTRNIKNKKEQVNAYPNVKTMVSLQARVAALPALYNQRTYMTKLAGILSSQEPQNVAFTSVSLSSGQLTITAEGKSYLAAATVAKAIAEVKADGNPYFSDVQLSAVNLTSGKTSYSITARLNSGATDGK